MFMNRDCIGILFFQKVFTEDCVFSEKLAEGNYNTYSSTLYSGRLRTLYLALNKFGQPRKVQIPAARPLGKLSTYARTLPITVSPERLDRLARNLGIIPSLRMCPLVPLRPSVAPEMDEFGRDRGRCRRRKKRKKRKRKDEEVIPQVKPKKKPIKSKKEEGLIANKKHGPKHRHHHNKQRKKTTEAIETTLKSRTIPDEDEEMDTSTEDDWEVTASLTDYDDSAK